MAALLDQLARLFVDPPAAQRPAAVGAALLSDLPAAGPLLAPVQPLRTPPSVVVLCAVRDLRVAGGAAALALAHLSRARCAVVAEWTGVEQPIGADRSAAPSARRTAAFLRTRGHAAQATGRLVRVALPAGEEGAAAEACRALALPSGDGSAAGTLAPPTVLALAGPRGAVLDDLIARQDLVLLVQRPGADADLAALAAADLEATGATVREVEIASSPGAAALARSGTTLVAPLRAPFLAALGGRF